MIEKFVKVRPIEPKDFEPLKEQIQKDNHVMYFPTHVVEKNNEYIGYLSLGSVPMVMVWMDTKKAKVIDSVQTLNIFENLARATGAGAIAVPCAKESPFFDYMVKLGFTQLSNMVLFAKNL